MGRSTGHRIVGRESVFSSADYEDAANDNGRVHAPWRRAVAAGIALLFVLSVVLIGLVCTTGPDQPAHSSNPIPVVRT